MLPVLMWIGLPCAVNWRVLGFVFQRSVFLILSTFSFVSGFAVMPVADALAIGFVEPYILLILGSLNFGDEVGPRRIAASAVGYGGALLVIQPSIAAFGYMALWPLGTAFFFASYMLVTRSTAAYMHPVAMQVHTSLAGVVIRVPLMVLFDGTGWAMCQTGRDMHEKYKETTLDGLAVNVPNC